MTKPSAERENVFIQHADKWLLVLAVGIAADHPYLAVLLTFLGAGQHFGIDMNTAQQKSLTGEDQ